MADGAVTVLPGDCLAVLPSLPDCSIDAIVTDPPYGLAELSAAVVLKAIAAWMAGDRTHVPDGRGFMGREWDKFVPPPGVWDECMRVLKPGGHLLSFAGSRTVDLMTLSIRIAGFEIRDSLQWLYGSGFPKSLDVGKAIDKAAGVSREVAGPRVRVDGKAPGQASHGLLHDGREKRGVLPTVVTAPATEDAARWSGWGTALKPAVEPIVCARKPLSAGTVAGNVLEWGTGALNIDATRVNPGEMVHGGGNGSGNVGGIMGPKTGERPRVEPHDAGRWPPNILLTHSPECVPTGTRRVPSTCHDHDRGTRGQRPGGFADIGAASGDSTPNGRLYADADGMETVEAWECAPGCPVAELDAQSGTWKSNPPGARGVVQSYSGSLGARDREQMPRHGDTGGASRFFPCFRYAAKAPASERPRLPDGTAWPTVKPLDMMRWLVRLVTPPGGTVLDPFAGTGTTGQAADLEGFRAILIERDPAALELIKVRLSKAIQPGLFA